MQNEWGDIFCDGCGNYLGGTHGKKKPVSIAVIQEGKLYFCNKKCKARYKRLLMPKNHRKYSSKMWVN